MTLIELAIQTTSQVHSAQTREPSLDTICQFNIPRQSKTEWGNLSLEPEIGRCVDFFLLPQLALFASQDGLDGWFEENTPIPPGRHSKAHIVQSGTLCFPNQLGA